MKTINSSAKHYSFIGASVTAGVAALWALYKHFSSRPPVQGPEPPDPAALRMSYLQLMAAEWSALPLEVLDPKASAVDTATRRLTLEQVYVSLDTNTPRPEWHWFSMIVGQLTEYNKLFG